MAPVLANISVGFFESKCLNRYNLNKLKFYPRYVEDIVAGFEKEQDPLDFLNLLNNKYANIKFTTKKQVNHSTTFLDVLISLIDNQNLTQQKYHKSNYTGLLLNFMKFTSLSYNIS